MIAPLLSSVLLAWLPRQDAQTTPPAQPGQDTPAILMIGHVVELRGSLDEQGRFVAEKAELQPATTDDVLIGTVPEGEKDPTNFVLLGQPIETTDATKWDKVEPSHLAGQRIKVEGVWKGPRRFLAKTVTARGPGRDRIGARIDELHEVEGGWEARVMIFTVLLKADTPVEHALPVAEYEFAKVRKIAIVKEKGSEQDEDELFGEGIALTSTLRFSGQIELRSSFEDNFDLDDSKQGDRSDYLLRLRGRFDWKPSKEVEGRLELRYDDLWRNDERSGDFADQNGFLGETYLRWNDAFRSNGLDLTVGRVKYSDPRRWIFHQNLDTVLASWNEPGWNLDLGAATTLSDGSPRDKAADELIAYVSNNDPKQNFAAWALYRDVGEYRIDSSTTAEETNLYVGARALGEFLPRNESWFDFAYEAGSFDINATGSRDVSAWGYDTGTTWFPPFAAPVYLTLGYALGTGDGSTTGDSGTFHQTGLEDNKGKFGGVTSFRYYGELMDPELTNLGILTAGIGTRITKKTSIDLVYHGYTQDVISKQLAFPQVQSNLKRGVLNGTDADLGSEYDLIFGYRQFADWDLEIIGAWFQAGDAWSVGDDAFLAKIQLRYRF